MFKNTISTKKIRATASDLLILFLAKAASKMFERVLNMTLEHNMYLENVVSITKQTHTME